MNEIFTQDRDIFFFIKMSKIITLNEYHRLERISLIDEILRNNPN